MISLRSVSIPIYTTLRRTGIVLVLLLERLALNKRASTRVHLSVAVMIGGALLAGARDLHFDARAYAIVFLYNASTALYLVLINRQSQIEAARPLSNQMQQPRLDKFDFMFYNNLYNLPFLVVLIAATGEWRAAVQLSHDWQLHGVGLPLAIGGSSLLAFALNYSIFLNTSVNSALTQTVAGQAKDVVTVVAGFVMFASDSPLDWMNLIGIVLGFVGSLLYGLFKLYPQWPNTTTTTTSATISTSSGVSNAHALTSRDASSHHAVTSSLLNSSPSSNSNKSQHPSVLHHHSLNAHHNGVNGSPAVRKFHPLESVELSSHQLQQQNQHHHPSQHQYTSVPVQS